jgi:arginine decarboxylase
MKFRFPIVIIDEDWRAESASGLGIRAVGKALEETGWEVIGGFTYTDVGLVANQAARASAFIVSIDDEEISEDGQDSKAIHELRLFISETRRRNADIPIFLFGEKKTLKNCMALFICLKIRQSSSRVILFVRQKIICNPWLRHFLRP